MQNSNSNHDAQQQQMQNQTSNKKEKSGSSGGGGGTVVNNTNNNNNSNNNSSHTKPAFAMSRELVKLPALKGKHKIHIITIDIKIVDFSCLIVYF